MDEMNVRMRGDLLGIRFIFQVLGAHSNEWSRRRVRAIQRNELERTVDTCGVEYSSVAFE